MTQTLLSAATWTNPEAQRVYSAPRMCHRVDSVLARDEGWGQWRRHSCLCAVAKPTIQHMAAATLSLQSKFLIANLELEFKLSTLRISDLRIPNRKFSTIFHRAQPPSRLNPLVTSHLSPATAFLIETPRLEIPIRPILSASSNFLIETQCRVCIPDGRPGAAFSLNPMPKTGIQCGREGESA